ncbi:protein NLRC3-like isoform X2 [Dysidea avara]|uniref:protein NLRC3-like isoform X2 n=1 Tax=Dysidea avara TaxID=196820 RepID=UPI0033324CA8
MIKDADKPQLKDLCERVTPYHASRWKEIGILLGLSKGDIEIIEKDNYKVSQCCIAMLETWTDIDPNYSWEKIETAISTSSDLADQSIEKVSMLSDHVKEIYKHDRFNIDVNAWPLEQPAEFTPVVLIHYHGNCSLKHDSGTIQVLHSEEGIRNMYSVASEELSLEQVNHEPVKKILETSKITKDISDILVPLETTCSGQTILIEGAPGIGKSVLLAEIANRWSNLQLLPKYKLVLLLCLRDPNLLRVTSLKDLFQYECRGSIKSADIDVITEFFFKDSGKKIVFLLDGYDEFPAKQQNNFIMDILRRRVLPNCGIIVSSRPHVSHYLRQQLATLRVEILGFTEKEQEQFIKHALKEEPHKIMELNQYFKNHLAIRSLCFIPFNMSVILSLYKNEDCLLPDSSTTMYSYFICLALCWNLKRNGVSINQDITELRNLPEPYCKFVKQLAKLSLYALGKNQLIFTLDEIKSFCPEMETIPGAINCFGLMQAIEHFSISHTTKTFNFLHLSIQEFLAANHVASLPQHEEYILLKEKFWDEMHSNMFMFYVAITKGQRRSFKKFLCGTDRKEVIDNKFLGDHLKAIHLFRCFKESKDDQMCEIIEKIFASRKILLTNGGRVPEINDLHSVTVLLTQSSIKTWEKLDVFLCRIQYHGIRILHQALANSNVIIKEIIFTKNILGASSDKLISEIVINCKVKILWASYNDFVGETEHFSTILSNPHSKLEMLYIRFNKLSSNAAILIFSALRKSSSRLKQLEISSNNITDDVCETLAAMVQDNKCLQRLEMYKNPIKYHEKSIPLILDALQHNLTLSVLGLPKYPDKTEEILSYCEAINIKRKALNCQVVLKINFE